MTRRLLGVACVAAVCLCACSLLTDLSGFAGGTDGGPLDAGAGFADAGGLPSDGDTPAADAAGDALDGACPSTPIALCERFAGGAAVNGWTAVAENGASIGRQVTAEGRSVLFANVPTATEGGAPVAYWSKGFVQVVSKLSFDADVIYDNRTVNPGEYHVLLQIRVEHGAGFFLAYVSVFNDNTQFTLQEFKGPTGTGEIDARVVNLGPKVAHHLHFDVAAFGRVRVAIDGAQVHDFATPGFVRAGTPTLTAGVTLSEVPTTAIQVAIDDVVFSGE